MAPGAVFEAEHVTTFGALDLNNPEHTAARDGGATVAIDGKVSEAASLQSGLFNRAKMERKLDEPLAASMLDGLDLPALLDLRQEIDNRLPPRKLTDIDLEEQLLLQFARTQFLYDSIINDEKVPANQRAQVANSCAASLEQLIKMQGKLHSTERLKALEQTLIRVLKTLPPETQESFIELYERALYAVAEAAAS